MRGKDHLFHLIHSLSKSEKRYFTLDARKGGKTNSRYLELFQRINKQEKYEEASLKNKFGARLGDDKARLYEAILGSMREYQSKKSYKIRIKELLTDAKILFERKLYDQSENRLNEAKGLALELQDHLAVLEINLRQRQLMKEYLDNDYKKQVENLIIEKNNHLKILEQYFWLHDKYDLFSIDVLKYPHKIEAEKRIEINNSYKNILDIKEENLDLSFHSLRRFYQIKALYFGLSGKIIEVLTHNQKIINLWKGNPKIIQENFIIYVGDFLNLIAATSKVEEKLASLPSLFNELKKNTPPNVQSKKLIFERLSIYELKYLLNTPDEDIKSSLFSIQEGLKEHNITPSSKLSILFNSILLLFLNDKFAQCIQWLDKLWPLLKKHPELRKDIHEGSRIILLLASYNTASFDDIENTLRSLNRYFSKNKKAHLGKLFNIIAHSLQDLQRNNSRRQEKQTLELLIQNIKNLKTPILAGLDEMCLLWAESLITNEPIQKLRLNYLR